MQSEERPLTDKRSSNNTAYSSRGRKRTRKSRNCSTSVQHITELWISLELVSQTNTTVANNFGSSRARCTINSTNRISRTRQVSTTVPWHLIAKTVDEEILDKHHREWCGRQSLALASVVYPLWISHTQNGIMGVCVLAVRYDTTTTSRTHVHTTNRTKSRCQ